MLVYLKQRLEERSTWAAIGVGITAAATLAWPWNAALLAVAMIGALVPSPGRGE